MNLNIAMDPQIAHSLVGTTLDGGWLVTEKLTPTAPDPAHTGGCFSVGYLASDGKRKVFVKALDIAAAMGTYPGNFMQAMGSLTRDHHHETSLLAICERAGLDRIVKKIGDGQVMITGRSGVAGLVPYIVFEYADGETLRKAVVKSDAIDTAWKIRRLHQVALGLSQLHSQRIAHQDLKPSNVLLFTEQNFGAKIGDLGRATGNNGVAMPHDGEAIAGDANYAPPEQAYGVFAEQEQDRREGCDLYHLGCLICFVFTGTVPTQAYLDKIPSELLPRRWNGTWVGDYATVLPILQATITEYLAWIEPHLPVLPRNGRAEMLEMVRNLCTPEYKRRGDPGARAQTGAPLGLDRFISRLDRLATLAMIGARSA